MPAADPGPTANSHGWAQSPPVVFPTAILVVVALLAVVTVNQLVSRHEIASIIEVHSRDSSQIVLRAVRIAKAHDEDSKKEEGTVADSDTKDRVDSSLVELARYKTAQLQNEAFGSQVDDQIAYADCLEHAVQQLRNLALVGSPSPTRTLHSIASVLELSPYEAAKQVSDAQKARDAGLPIPGGACSGDVETMVGSPGSVQFWWTAFDRAPSDYLLAIAIVCCGIAGSVILGMRSRKPEVPSSSLADAAFGLASGLVCFFALKGGKTVMIVDLPGTPMMVNPYGSAFLGLLAGMFSSKFFGMITTIVDAATKRFVETLNPAVPTLTAPQGPADHAPRAGNGVAGATNEHNTSQTPKT